MQYEVFGSEEMLSQEQQASAITFSSQPKKVILHEPQCHICLIILGHNNITFALCVSYELIGIRFYSYHTRQMAPRVNM